MNALLPEQPLALPLLVAPMFLVSTPELAIASARSGVVGSLPAANARTVADLEQWLQQIDEALRPEGLPWLLNMIVHRTYDRFDDEMALVKTFQPPLVSTALGSPARVTDTVKGYGGKVLADVITPAMARKSVEAGVDGLILVTHGAGGHTGIYNPLAFLAEVREFWDGPLGIAGCVSRGADVLAMLAAGADFVVSGTRYIPAAESMVSGDYRQMLVDAGIQDIIESDKVSGVRANWLRASLEQAGFTPDENAAADFSGNIASQNKAWKHVWSAGQGVGNIRALQDAAVITQTLSTEFQMACTVAWGKARSYLP
ncbi:MAG: nitronate monooxygenase [Gammaproteobacteria bacterium]|nr:nitronate monooxygenase [Gammaproteobacteria bacterium]